MAIGRFLAPLNGNMVAQQIERPYVDDIFDPLFNAEVRNYYNNLYGPVGGIGAGYAAMLDNALMGRKGILGPGMGILSTFGRSMDKADDFILGGLTEGVNTLGQLTGGNNPMPTNPIKNIFVNDYDYQGTKLMAAMGNAMARLTGTQTPLDESDFQTLGDKAAGMSIDLATDPGIMGGQLARLNPGTPVGRAGQILSDYDDVMANIAGNMAFPGGKALIGKGLTRIRDFLGGASETSPVDMATKTSKTTIIDPSSGLTTYSNLDPGTLATLKKMSDDYTANLDPIEDADLYAIKEDIDRLTNVISPEDYNKYLAEYDTAQIIKAAHEQKKNDAVTRIILNASKERDDIMSSSLKGMENHAEDFQRGGIVPKDPNPEVLKYFDQEAYDIDDSLRMLTHGEGVNPEDYIKWKRLYDLSKKELDQFVKDNFADYEETDYYGNPLEFGKFYEDFKYTLKEYGLQAAKDKVFDKIQPTTREFTKSNFNFAPNKMGFQSVIAKDSLDVINYHIKEFVQKHPKGLYNTFLKDQLGTWIPENVFNALDKYSKGQFVDYDTKTITGKKFQQLLDTLYSRKLDMSGDLSEGVQEVTSKKISLIPWVRQNEAVLQKTQLGRDLITLADNLEADVFDNNLYEMANKSVSVDNVASYNEAFGAASIDKYLGDYREDLLNQQVQQQNIGGGMSKNTYNDVFEPATMLNQRFSKSNFTPKDFETYARDFPKLDLKVSQDYIKNSPQYKEYIEKLTKVNKDIADEKYLRERITTLRKMTSDPTLLDVDPYAWMEYKDELQRLSTLYKKINPNMDPKVWRDSKDYLLKNIKRAPTDLEEMLEKYYIPAKKKYWQEVNGTPYAYEFTNLNPKNIYDASKKALKMPSFDAYEKISSSLATFSPEDMARTITNNFSTQDNTAMAMYEQVFDNFKNDWSLPGDIPPFDLEPYIRTFGTKTEKTLFQQWRAAVQSKVRNKLQTARGVYQVESVRRTKAMVDALVKSKKYTEEQIAEYITRKDLEEGVVLHANNFLESLWASQGFKEIPLSAKDVTKEEADTIAAALAHNVNAVNKYGDILKFVDIPEKDGTRRLAIFFNTDNLDIKKDLNKIYGLFGKKDIGLQDVVVRKPTIKPSAFDTKELDAVFDQTRNASEELARTLGFTKVSPNYISHAMEDSEEARQIFSNIYASLGIDRDKLNKLTQALQDQDIASGKLQFGAIPMERSHLGYFNQYGKGFSAKLEKIHASTFTNGMLENTDAQTFFDLFLSDNFKIKQNFDSVDKLKEALNLSEGNLNNLSIVKPRYNDQGKLIGFTRFDKFDDASLAKAFNDDETILVPDAVIGSLDRICKKDAKMSSRVYRFINKYLTVPFKFGTLANPGFLAGNIQDAYFKQATILAKKYNTTLSEELTNVAMSMRQVTQLNNQFSNVFDQYKAFLSTTDLKNITRSDKPADWYYTTFKKSKNMVDTLTIDRVLNEPELYKAFKEYVNTHLDPANQRVAKFYIWLNNNQTTTMFKNNTRDLEDVKSLVDDNPYAVPNNFMERIMYGDPSKTKIVKINGRFKEIQDRGFRSWGLFLNNPVSNKILKSSNTIENWMRSASIINDLQHQGYTIEDICDILGTNKVTEKAIRDKFGMSMNEALNTMYAANFDYDNVSSFMDKMSYILPFPTFYLKNLAFWADIFTNKPQYIDNIISVHENLWSGKDTKDEFTAEAKGRGAVPIGQQDTPITKHLTGIVKQTPYNSMFSAFNAVNNFKEDFAYRTNPALRRVTRHLQDPDDIRYRPYNMNQYQKNIKKGDPQFSNLAYMFHQLNPYERFINTGLRTPGKIANNTYQVSDFLPSMVQPDFSKK